MDSQMPDGKNLRETQLDRENLITTIKCGRPGTGMPAFDKFAYSDGRCYGLKLADLKARDLMMVDPPATLAPREIELLADFLFAKVIGQGPMTHAKCIEYWGSEVEGLAGSFPTSGLLRMLRRLQRDRALNEIGRQLERFVDQRGKPLRRDRVDLEPGGRAIGEKLGVRHRLDEGLAAALPHASARAPGPVTKARPNS